MTAGVRRVALGVTLAGAAAPPALAAQRAPADGPRMRPELRLDAVAASAPAVLVGAGLVTDAGLYARLALTAGAGPAFRRDAALARVVRPRGEVAAVARFLLDPLRQAPRGVYVGGGVGMRVEEAQAPRYFVLATLGIEGRPRGRIAPSLEAGVGGGARVGVVLRSAQRRLR